MSKRKLTIGMATYDDYDGVYFSLMAIRIYHQEVADRLEFFVLDNNPDSPSGKAVEQLKNHIPNLTYFPFTDFNSTASRDIIFREAKTAYVLCMDSHVFFMPGALQGLLDYYDQNPNTNDLIQGPLIYDNLQNYSTHFRQEWQEGMYGVWATDQRGALNQQEAFDIPMQGLGVFSCRKAAWQGFNPRFRGFGGEEGYIHEKYRQAGYRSLCLPVLRWVHRFNRPNGTKYPNLWEDRIRNYIIGHRELGMDTTVLEQHFTSILGQHNFQTIKENIIRELEHSFAQFDAIFWIKGILNSFKTEEMETAFDALGIKHLIRSIELTASPGFSKAVFLEKAQQYGFKQVLVFQDYINFEVSFADDFDKEFQLLNKEQWETFVPSAFEGSKVPIGLFTPKVIALKV